MTAKMTKNALKTPKFQKLITREKNSSVENRLINLIVPKMLKKKMPRTTMRMMSPIHRTLLLSREPSTIPKGRLKSVNIIV